MSGIPSWDLPSGLDTPAVLVDVAKVEQNAIRAAKVMSERRVDLRPHAKTHKSLEVARILLGAGASGLTTATLGEAEVFATGGFDDLFVAYPVWAVGAKAERLRSLARTTRLRVGVDSVEGAEVLAEAAAGLPLKVLLEVDSGERRTGVQTPEHARQVTIACLRGGLDVVGVFTHGGHSYAAPDAATPAGDDEVTALDWAASALADAGVECGVRSAGSTPTSLLSERPGVTEERPGTFVFGDRQQVMLGACRPQDVALVVATTVVSSDRSGRVVLDAGGKTLAKDRNPLLDGFGEVLGHPGATITATYDHHALVDVSSGPLPRVGDVLAVVPNHVCPVVNLADELVVVEGARVLDRWRVDARGRNR